MGVFRIISLVMALEIRSPFGTTRPHSILASDLVSPRPLSLSIRRQGIWSFMLERDEAHRLHSNSIREVVRLKARVDYLQVTLQVAKEEVAEAWALATATQV